MCFGLLTTIQSNLESAIVFVFRPRLMTRKECPTYFDNIFGCSIDVGYALDITKLDLVT